MTRQIEKLTAFDRARASIFFSGIHRFQKNTKEIQIEFSKRKESFTFIKKFLFEENFENYEWAEVNEHLKHLRDFHEILIHHQWWEGARELDSRLWDIIGITKRIYVLLRQAQTNKIKKTFS